MRRSTTASFDRTLSPPPPPDYEADIVIGAFSSVTGSVVIDADAVGPIVVTVEELASTVVNGVVTSNGALLARRRQDERHPADRRRRKPTDHRDSRTRGKRHSHRHAPVGGPSPGDDDAVHAAAVHPAVIDQPLHATAVHPAIDRQSRYAAAVHAADYRVRRHRLHVPGEPGWRSGGCGGGAAGCPERGADDRELSVPGDHQPRVAARRASRVASRIDGVQELQVSQIRAPFTQQPFTQQPFTQQPFTQQPFTQQPFTQQPFTQQPFTQQSNPSDPVNSNSTFYLAPSPTPGQSARLRLPGSGRSESVAAKSGRRSPAHAGPAASAARTAGLSGATRGSGPDLHAPCVPDLGQSAGQDRRPRDRAGECRRNRGGRHAGSVGDRRRGAVRSRPVRRPRAAAAGVPVRLPFVQQPATGVGQTLAPVHVAVTDGFGQYAQRPPADPGDHCAR